MREDLTKHPVAKFIKANLRFLTGVLAVMVASITCYFLWIAPNITLNADTPSQYGRSVLDYLQATGIEGDSDSFKQARKEAETRISQAQTAQEVRSILVPAIEAAGGGYFEAPQTESFTPKTEGLQQSEVTHKDGVTTIKMPTLGGGDSLDLRLYATNITDGIAQNEVKTCGWMIDLRSSQAVDLPYALQPLHAFLPEGTVLEIKHRKGADEIRVTGSEIEQGGAVRANGDKIQKQTNEPVAVLIDEHTSQAAALAARALSASEQVHFFGTENKSDNRIWNEMKMPDGWVLKVVAGTYQGVASKGAQTDDIISVEGTAESASKWLLSQCNQ